MPKKKKNSDKKLDGFTFIIAFVTASHNWEANCFVAYLCNLLDFQTRQIARRRFAQQNKAVILLLRTGTRSPLYLHKNAP